MFENDDDYDFNPSDSSKLSSLFGSFTLQNEETSNSLMYTAPKQPYNTKSREVSEKQPASSKVMLIKIVSLWKSEEKSYKPLGKHGLAVIGSDELKTYEIIAYKHKTHTILRATINNQFHFQQRKDNFSSFMDNNLQNWLVKFETYEQQLEFGDFLKSYSAIILIENLDQSKDEKNVSKPIVSPKPDVPSNGQDSDSSDSTRKANILSRITKMGQQIMPKPVSALESDISDEYDNHESKTRKFRKVKKIERDDVQHISDTVSNEIVQKHLIAAPQVPHGYYPQPAFGDFNAILLAQNSELRCSLNKISEQLDDLNIQKKESTSGLNSKIKVLQLRTENLQTELQRYKQKCYDLETKNNSKQDENSLEILNLKDTILELNSQILEANNKIMNLGNVEKELERSKEIILEHERIIDTQKHSLEELDLFYQQSKTKNAEADLSITNLNEKLQEYEDLFQKSESEKQKLLQKHDKYVDVLTNLVKSSMNGMYQSILNTLDPDGSFTFSDVQGALAKNMKDTSFQIINGIKAELQNNGDEKE